MFKTDWSNCEKDYPTDYKDLVEYCQSKGYCPMPHEWNEFFEMLPNDAREIVGLPLILSMWAEAPFLHKYERFSAHLEYAFEKGLLKEADTFLRGLDDDQWFSGELWN